MRSEKRKFQRFDLALPARVEVLDQMTIEEKPLLTLATKNISQGGAFFPTSSPLPEGTEVKVDLVLPLNGLDKIKEDRSYMQVKGRVLRSDPDGMAISFREGVKLRPLPSSGI